MQNYLTKVKLGFLSILLTFLPFKVFAKEIVSGNTSTSYAMTYAEAKAKLSQFTSKVWFGNDWFGLSAEMLYLINGFVQSVFWVTKSIFYVCAGIYEYLSDLSAFDSYVLTALIKSSQVFEGLKTQFLPAVGIAMAVYVSYIFFVKNGSFVQTLLKLLITFTCASMLFGQYNGKYVMKHVYDGMIVITDEVVEKTFQGISFGDDNLTTDKAFTGQGKSAVLDKYFDIAIWQPYKYLNGDVLGVDGGNVSFFFTDQEYIDLLEYNSGDDGFKLNDVEIKNVVGTNKEPKNMMMKANWGKKFTYAFSSLIDAFVLGVILDVFAIAAFVMRLMIILLIILGAFVAIIAMFPTMDNVLVNFIKSVGINLSLSGLMSFFALVLLWFYDVLSAILNTLLVGQPFLMAVAKILILWGLYKKRDTIVSILTANRVSRLSNRLTNRLSTVGSRFGNRVQDNALSKLRLASTAGRETMSGALKIGARKAGQNTRRLLNRFNPTVEPDVNNIRDVERKDGQYDIQRFNREGRQRNNVESVKDFGRNLSSFKHQVQGTIKKVRSEGVRDKDSQTYRDLRTDSERHLTISQAKKSKALGYRQRQYNQETKERLMRQRSERLRSNLTRHSSMSDNQVPSLKPKGKVVSQSVKPTQVSRDNLIKRERIGNRQDESLEGYQGSSSTSLKPSNKVMVRKAQPNKTYVREQTRQEVVLNHQHSSVASSFKISRSKDNHIKVPKSKEQDSSIERLNPTTGDFNKPFVTETKTRRIKGRLNKKQ